MHDEACPGFLGGPSSELHDFKDLRSLGGGVVWPLVSRLPFSLRSKNSQLSLEQRGVVMQGIPLPEQPNQRRGVLKHPGPSRHRGTHKDNGNAIGHLPH